MPQKHTLSLAVALGATALCAILLILGVFIFENTEEQEATLTTEQTATSAEVVTYHMDMATQMSIRAHEIDSLIQEYQRPSFNSANVMMQEINRLKGWQSDLEAIAGIDTLAHLAKSNLPKLRRLREREFPALRAAFCEHKANELWEDNYEVTCSGIGKTRLTVVHYSFANNAAKKQFVNKVYDSLLAFRFRRIDTKWIASEPEYTYWDLDPPRDGD